MKKQLSINLNKINSTAKIIGQSLIVGENTRIGEGVIIENSYLENAVVEAGAKIIDSVLITRGEIPKEKRKSDFEDRWIIKGAPVKIGEGSEIIGSTLKNTSIGSGTRCAQSAIYDSTIGANNVLKKMYGESVHTEFFVTVEGPTELYEAWVGHHAVIDKCGYFEGIFSNDFYVIEFDEKKQDITVKDTIDLPHLSRYGMNTINSLNSGKVVSQPENKLKSLGPYVGLWYDHILRYEPIKLAPCCWVSGWTKIIGKSAQVHHSAEELVKDSLSTYIMLFSVAGKDKNSVIGQTMPGELNNGYSYKNRFPAWVFTYAPGAVINIVKELYKAGLEKHLTDQIVLLALKNAAALTYYYARQRNINLNTDTGRDAKGWREWLINSKRMLEQHIHSGLWEFKDGEPVGWCQKNGKWIPNQPELLLRIAPDAIENQCSENDLLQCNQPPLEHSLGASEEELFSTLSDTTISNEASVSKNAFIGPGVQIKGKSVVGDNVWLYRTVVDNCKINKGAHITRCALHNSRIGEKTEVTSTSIKNSSIGNNSNISCGQIESSTISANAKINPFAKIHSTRIAKPCIIGTTIFGSEADSILMSYHMPGYVSGLKVLPAKIYVDGKLEEVFAIPMLGGGLRVYGSPGKEVTVECSFIGSNAVLEGGAYVGFGSFVLGQLQGDEGLLPFTISTDPGPEKDQIGEVASNLANIVISHFINWTFQANGTKKASLVGRLVISMLKEGRDAVLWEIEQRELKKEWDENSPYSKYKSLKLYSDVQLKSGLAAYECELSDDRWCLEYIDKELRFTGKGSWLISDGIARWESDER